MREYGDVFKNRKDVQLQDKYFRICFRGKLDYYKDLIVKSKDNLKDRFKYLVSESDDDKTNSKGDAHNQIPSSDERS